MKVFHVLTVLAVIAVSSPLVHTQTQTRTRTGARKSRPSTRPANIAVIDTIAFTDQKRGINRMLSAMRQLQAKYEPVRVELVRMRSRLTTMRSEIQKKRGVQDPRMTAEQADEAERLDRRIKQKAEEAEANYNKDRLAAIGPLQTDVANALNAYAHAKRITLVIDLNQVPVIFAAPSLNITKDFIADYNRKNPATPAPARP